MLTNDQYLYPLAEQTALYHQKFWVSMCPHGGSPYRSLVFQLQGCARDVEAWEGRGGTAGIGETYALDIPRSASDSNVAGEQ